MTWQDDYNTFADIRDEVIDSLIPENEKEEITGVMRSLELALIASENKEGTMKVTRGGTETIELYIRYLERFVFKHNKLSIKNTKQILSRIIDCPQCKGLRYINKSVKRKRVAISCPKCKGKGTVKKELECGKA